MTSRNDAIKCAPFEGIEQFISTPGTERTPMLFRALSNRAASPM
jgi:hypothetical protein